MKTYFGDLHDHCGITYGFGSLENAINRQKASWISPHLPDMPCGRICMRRLRERSLWLISI